jgi:hypothetical protein
MYLVFIYLFIYALQPQTYDVALNDGNYKDNL